MIWLTMREEAWEKVISMGVDFASDVCLSYENYISEGFAARLKISIITSL